MSAEKESEVIFQVLLSEELLMDYINKLPFILSALMTILIGFISFRGTDSQQDTYVKMAVSMVAFYVVGRIIKKTFLEIYKDIEKKEEERREKDKQDKENATNESAGSEGKTNGTEPETNPQKIDYRVED